MTIYAYLRVSTDNKGQTTDNQEQKINDCGYKIDKWIREEVSGTIKALDRKGFSSMMDEASSGDTVIVTMLDRLGRNAMDILNTVEAFKSRKIKLKVLQLDGVDLTSGTGMLVLMVMSAMAQIERESISERSKQGLVRTRSAGTKLGPPFKVTPDQLKALMEEKKRNRTSDMELSYKYQIPRSTISHIIKEWGDKIDMFEAEYHARVEQHKANKLKRESK